MFNLTDVSNRYGKQQKNASFISIAGWKRMQPLSFLLYDDFTNQQNMFNFKKHGMKKTMSQLLLPYYF